MFALCILRSVYQLIIYLVLSEASIFSKNQHSLPHNFLVHKLIITIQMHFDQHLVYFWQSPSLNHARNSDKK